MLALTTRERRALEAALQATRDRWHWCRLRAVLLAGAGTDLATIQHTLGVSRSSVFEWLACYRARRTPQALADAPRCGRPARLDAAALAHLAALLTESPLGYGYQSHGWTVGLLTQHLARVKRWTVSASTLRRALHALGYGWKRPRYVLARRDGARGEKAARPAAARRSCPSAWRRRAL